MTAKNAQVCRKQFSIFSQMENAPWLPQRKGQFHVNLFFTCLPLNSPCPKESLTQCQWLVAAPRQITRSQKFCFCCFCGTNHERRLPNRGVSTLGNVLHSLCAGLNSLGNRKELTGDLAAKPQRG